jgi:hypothetical protein
VRGGGSTSIEIRFAQGTACAAGNTEPSAAKYRFLVLSRRTGPVMHLTLDRTSVEAASAWLKSLLIDVDTASIACMDVVRVRMGTANRRFACRVRRGDSSRNEQHPSAERGSNKTPLHCFSFSDSPPEEASVGLPEEAPQLAHILSWKRITCN